MTDQPSAEALLSVYRAALAYRDAIIVGMEVGQAHEMLLFAIEASRQPSAILPLPMELARYIGEQQQAAPERKDFLPHNQCPSCYWHPGHDPDEWFAEEAKIRGYSAPAGGRRDRPAATDPLEQARQNGFEQGIAAAAEYVEARPNEQPAVLAGLMRDLGSMYAAEATIAVVHRDWAKAVAAGKEEKHAALLARLQEPDVREAVKATMRERDFARDGEYLPDDCYEAFADAALTKIAEMLTP